MTSETIGRKAADTDLPDNSMDMLLLFGVLTCITDNYEQELLVSEFHRILKPAGVLYMIFPV